MGLFSVDEVLQLAMQAEESGRLLYAAMAHETADPQIASLAAQLAAQEKTHYDRFASMRQEQTKKYDQRRLSLEALQFIESLVQGKVIPNEAQARRLAKENDSAKVLDMAIQAEVDSQAFYGHILAGVDASDAAVIREIIAQEKIHEDRLRRIRHNMPA